MSAVLPRIAEIFAGVDVLSGLVGPLRWTAGAPLLVVGLLGLTVGARRRLPLAVAGGAVLGALAAAALRELLGLHLAASPALATGALAGLGAVALGLVPAALPFAALALPAAYFGVLLPLAGRASLGAAVSGLVLGALGLLFGRAVRAIFASLCGGVAAGAGLELPAAVVVGLALVLGIAGAALQLATPEGPGARSPGSPPSASPGGAS